MQLDSVIQFNFKCINYILVSSRVWYGQHDISARNWTSRLKHVLYPEQYNLYGNEVGSWP